WSVRVHWAKHRAAGIPATMVSSFPMTPPVPLADDALLARLVALDTTSHRSNRELAEFIAGYLDRPGVRITRHPTSDGAKLNLIVAAGPADGEHGLVLSGHMDTVP